MYRFPAGGGVRVEHAHGSMCLPGSSEDLQDQLVPPHVQQGLLQVEKCGRAEGGMPRGRTKSRSALPCEQECEEGRRRGRGLVWGLGLRGLGFRVKGFRVKGFRV